MQHFCESWTELKSIISKRNLQIQYKEYVDKYLTYAIDGVIEFSIELWRDTSNITGIDNAQNDIDLLDFETNYKSDSNNPLSPTSIDGKQIVRAESRPLGYTTSFTCIGDSDTDIGDGKELFWDFSNDDDLISSDESIKTKRIEFKFLDDIYLKEGTIYFDNALKKSYIDICVLCPSGQYYLNNNGVPTLATEDTVIHQYLSHHFIYGSCHMGDELNTEACSSKIPSYCNYRIDITVPVNDQSSIGHVSVELYRSRTVIL